MIIICQFVIQYRAYSTRILYKRISVNVDVGPAIPKLAMLSPSVEHLTLPLGS